MNFSHLKTIAWLRWRLMANQLGRTGTANRIITLAVVILGVLGSCGLFFITWLGTRGLFNKMEPPLLMLVWTGLALAFLFGWCIGVITDLQRSEPLSLDKFLHLPVSPRGAFLMNFLSSFISIAVILMFPILLGFSFGMVQHYGPGMIPGVFLLLAFLLLVVSVTYQFRGWLAAIMVNPRKRRAIITGMTMFIIVLSQIPNLLNLTVFHEREKSKKKRAAVVAAQNRQWQEELENSEISEDEFRRRVEQVKRQRDLEKKRQTEELAGWARIPNTIIPFGWMPLGIEKLATHRYLVPVACLLGMVGLACFSLQRSYRTTLRMYRGNLGQPKTGVAAKPPDGAESVAPAWAGRIIARRFPLLSEHQSAIAANMLVSSLRAPESKLALLTPFIIMVLLGMSFAFRDGNAVPDFVRSISGIGVATFIMLGITSLINNQFGYDRDGFRCYVLSPVRGRDILIGKNLALAPLAFLLSLAGIAAIQIFIPMKFTHCLASIVQCGTVFLVTCMIGNIISIHAPLAVSAGSMKPLNMKLGVVLLQLLFTILLPICLLPTMIPPGVEYAAKIFFGIEGIPLFLLLSVLLFAATVLVYRIVVSRQGETLKKREQDILETVTQVGT